MDLDKVFLEDLKNENFEYMILDTYYDTNFGVVDIGDNRYITNNIRLNQTEFFKNLEYKRFLTIQNNTAEYFELWKKSCDSFFEYLETYCPDLKVILNPSRHVYKVLNEDGSYTIPVEFVDIDKLKLFESRDVSKSDFVYSKFGIYGVCEPSALIMAGFDSKLIYKKTSYNGVTISVAVSR